MSDTPEPTMRPGEVTARFYVSEMTDRAHDPEAAQIVLQPAYNNGSGNEAWAVATPSGKIEMYVANPTAVQWFRDRLKNRRDLHITFGDVPDEPDTD